MRHSVNADAMTGALALRSCDMVSRRVTAYNGEEQTAEQLELVCWVFPGPGSGNRRRMQPVPWGPSHSLDPAVASE